MTSLVQRPQALAVVVLLLSACASAPDKPAAPIAAPTPTPAALATQRAVDAKRRADFDKSLAGWHGARQQELLAKLGAPSSKARGADGRLVYTYARTAKQSGPGGFSCVVRYMIDDKADKVVGHSFEGC